MGGHRKEINMNIVAPAPVAVNAPVTTMTPSELGIRDARLGLPCNPDAYFDQPNDYDKVGAKYDRADYRYAYSKAKGW
jgi:hypothetical protein